MPDSLPRAIRFFRFFLWLNVLWNGLRLWGAIQFWGVLQEYGARGGALYLAASGGVWTVAGLALLLLLPRPRPLTWRLALGFVLAWEAWFWFDRLLLQETHVNTLFVLLVNLSWLILTLLILFLPATRSYYYERTP